MDKLFQIESIQGDDFIGLEKAQLTGIKKALADFANQVIKDAKGNLIRGNHISSDSLNALITPLPIKQIDGGYMIEIEMNDYWKYVDQGVQGAKSSAKAIGSPFKYKEKGPPIQSLANHITNKGIKVTPTKDRKTGQMRSSLEQVMIDARGMSRAIKNYGTPRTLFLTNALPESAIKELTENVATLYGKSISISIKL
jgi:hypothetical protein